MMKNKSVNVIDILKKISDINFQKEVWLEGKYWDWVSSFEEAVNLLEDYDFFVDVNENNIRVTENEKKVIENFNDKLMEYESNNIELMLSDNNWKNIVNMAYEVSEILKKYNW
ncbi:hypothetical protein [Flavobacterium sp. HNIBRBA15423]|uniref:hypothetical protein n=1 Tax=Flavobacterium sp. HNIBRBA15423 TaxID=3458683 RepID=UPI00404441A9